MHFRKDRQGNELSILGYGCMRFPQTMGKINLKETEQQIMAAIKAGVNYFDTAYVYGGSEAALVRSWSATAFADRWLSPPNCPIISSRARQAWKSCFRSSSAA